MAVNLQSPFSMAAIQHSLSSSISISSPTSLFLTPKLSTPKTPLRTTTIRMGGGPRTYPGGVSKWQWMRMRAKKSKQLLKARLARERQIYEMRKRAELKSAMSELERPWELVEKSPTLFSVAADEQVKVLADRFQRPGGFDLWSEKDGPELFRSESDLPSARFFPKGVVHSIKPYRNVDELSNRLEQSVDLDLDSDSENDDYLIRVRDVSDLRKQNSNNSKTDKGLKNNFRKGNRRKHSNGLERVNSNDANSRAKRIGKAKLDQSKSAVFDTSLQRRLNSNDANSRAKRIGKAKLDKPKSDVFDMSLQSDGSYEFEAED